MAAENKTNLPSGSVDTIPKEPLADESVKAATCGTTAADPFTAIAPNRFDMHETGGNKACELKTEENGSLSMNLKLQGGGAPEIVVVDEHEPLANSERGIGYKEVFGFLKAPVDPESAGGDNKEKLFKLHNFPSAIEEQDVKTEIENGKLVFKLSTKLEEGEIKRVEELPFDATGGEISTFMEGRTFVVKFTFEKPEPKEKPKSTISKIWQFAKGAMKKAVPACLVVGGKEALDKMINNEPNAEPEAEPNVEQE